jgi:predicted dehydrogenase
VGIAGLGRSGWNIHAKTLLPLKDKFQIVAVADSSAERVAEAVAACQCRAYENVDGLLNDEEIDLLVVATPNHLHTQHAIGALQRGKHVVCEKPFAVSTADADRTIDVGRQTGRIVAPFHNRRYEAHLQQVCRVIASGVLGEVLQIRITWHSFGRRWDWQTLKEFGGGSLNNNGSHLLDHALQVFGEGEPSIFADVRHTSMTSGDADDHLKVVLYGKGHPTVDCELTNAAAYIQDRWHIMGTSGGLRGTTDKLEWKWVDFAKMPPRPVERTPPSGRSYNSEKLDWKTETWTAPADLPPVAAQFYKDLFETIRNDKPLVITPQSIRRLIRVIEECQKTMKDEG